jgi:hypothetical protein
MNRDEPPADSSESIRMELDPDRLTALFLESDLPENRVREFFAFLRTEFEVQVGKLRPEDPPDALITVQRTRNPFTWMAEQVRKGDLRVELDRELRRRMATHGNEDAWSGRSIETLREVVRAWSGAGPRAASG